VANQQLEIAVLEILTACESVGMANRQVNANSQETIKNYALVVGAKGITAADLRAAMAEILCEEFFPKPGTLEKLAGPFRDARIEREYAEKWRGAVEMVDEQGRLWLVPQDRVELAELPGPRGGLRKVHSDTPILSPRALSAGGTGILRSLGYEPRDGREPHHAE
jgi:hypothetical protein